jgi:hypothetical protein
VLPVCEELPHMKDDTGKRVRNMTLPMVVRHSIDNLIGAFCEQREAVGARAHERVEYRITANEVVIIDSKPNGLDFGKWTHKKIANFQFNAGIEKWTLYWYDKHGKRQLYPVKSGEADLEELIRVIEDDCTGIFWG